MSEIEDQIQIFVRKNVVGKMVWTTTLVRALYPNGLVTIFSFCFGKESLPDGFMDIMQVSKNKNNSMWIF